MNIWHTLDLALSWMSQSHCPKCSCYLLIPGMKLFSVIMKTKTNILNDSENKPEHFGRPLSSSSSASDLITNSKFNTCGHLLLLHYTALTSAGSEENNNLKENKDKWLAQALMCRVSESENYFIDVLENHVHSLIRSFPHAVDSRGNMAPCHALNVVVGVFSFVFLCLFFYLLLVLWVCLVLCMFSILLGLK